MTNERYEKILRWFSIGQIILVAYMIVSVIVRGVIDGRKNGTTAGLISSIFTSILIALVIVLFFLAMNKGFQWWEKLSEWLEKKLQFYPAIRRAIIALGVASSPLIVYWAVSRMEADIATKTLMVLVYGLILPAAIISLTQEDKAKEKSPLASFVSREVFLRDPQAAVAKAFTVVEHRLKEKMSDFETKNYGNRLINEAYQGEDSKLILLLDGKDRTSQLRDLLSGAYSLLRNPRHHSLVEDDKYTASEVYAVAELLLHFVSASEQRHKIE